MQLKSIDKVNCLDTKYAGRNLNLEKQYVIFLFIFNLTRVLFVSDRLPIIHSITHTNI